MKYYFWLCKVSRNCQTTKTVYRTKYPNVNQSHVFFDRSPLNQFESFVSNSFYHKNKYFLSINVLPLISHFRI